jgi:hypothetical protein
MGGRSVSWTTSKGKKDEERGDPREYEVSELNSSRNNIPILQRSKDASDTRTAKFPREKNKTTPDARPSQKINEGGNEYVHS